MRASREGFPAFALRFTAIAVTSALAWSCGDGGGPTTPPPSGTAVASVVVTPSSATLAVDGTVQLSAVPLDADGAPLTGRTVTWSTSRQSVATVSQSGLVTGVAGGEALVTASSEGRSATSTITVTPATSGDVVASATIGAGGGTVGNDDVGVTIPAGELSSSTEIRILSSDDAMDELGDGRVTERYALHGFPQDREVELRVRLRATGSLADASYIAVGVPVVRSSTDVEEEERGMLLHEAVDSAGYLVATIAVRGRGAQGAPQAAGAAAPQQVDGPLDGLLDGLLGGVTGVRADTIPGGHFVIVSWGEPRATLQARVSRAAELLEDARTALIAQGYTTSHRFSWPMEVRIYPMRAGLYGSFNQVPPFPLNVDESWFELNTWAFEQPDLPGTVIHEFFHFVQARYTASMTAAEYNRYGWIKEAGSTWMEVKAPQTIGVFRNSFFYNQRSDLFLGLYPSLQAKDGYGKAPVMMYVADRWGTARVRGIFENVGGGMPAVDALLTGIPEGPDSWWPDLLTKYMKGELVALAADELPPPAGDLPILPGVNGWTLTSDLRPLAARFLPFTPKADAYGTGTTLTLRLPDALRTAGVKFLPFRMTTSGAWEAQGGVVDSLVIEGADLRLGRRYGVYLIQTEATAPYTQSWTTKFETELGYGDGDWIPRDVTVTSDAIVYSGDDDEDGKMDVPEGVTSLFEALATDGVWKRTDADPNLYRWEPTEELAEELEGGDVSAMSEARIKGDSVFLNATIDIYPPSSAPSRSGSAAGFGAMGLLLLVVGLAARRERRVAVVAAAGTVLVVGWGCHLSLIDFSMKFRYEVRLASPELTASATDITVPLVRMTEGTGTFFVDRYRVEWWEYIEDEEGEIVDSVARVRTATGQATVRLEADLFEDGVITDEDEGLARLGW